MDKVYVLTIDNQDEDFSSSIAIRVFSDKTKAIQEAKNIVAEFENECDLDGWEIEKFDDENYYSYSAWEDGYYDRNHYNVKVEELNVE